MSNATDKKGPEPIVPQHRDPDTGEVYKSGQKLPEKIQIEETTNASNEPAPGE